MEWWRFLKIALLTASAAVAAAYAFILVVDPYDIFPVSPDLPRPTMDVNQRLAYPALARNPDFDSAVFGTSTARLLRPGRLDEILGGRFLNLGLNNGAAYEQYRIAKANFKQLVWQSPRDSTHDLLECGRLRARHHHTSSPDEKILGSDVILVLQCHCRLPRRLSSMPGTAAKARTRYSSLAMRCRPKAAGSRMQRSARLSQRPSNEQRP